MTVGEVADILLRDYAVSDALNLDGGCSTTMAMQDPVSGESRIVNEPSDNLLGRGRPVGSSLAVLARPILDRTMRPAIARTTTNTIVISWPATSAGWHLQQSLQQDSGEWSDVGAIPEPAGDAMEVILESREQTMFYRLVR